MTRPAADAVRFDPQEWDDLEEYLDERLATVSGLCGVALIEITAPHISSAEELLAEHVDAEDHTSRVSHNRFAIVRSPLIGPAEMEGLGLRIADSFPTPEPTDGPVLRSALSIGVVTGRQNDRGRTLLRHAQFALDDAKVVGRPIITGPDGLPAVDAEAPGA